MQPHKVIICEDHDITTDGLRVLISFHPEFVVVGHAHKLEELHPLLTNQVDILILDLNLGSEDGFVILEKIRKDHPNIRVLILTMYDDAHLIEKARKLKANGYLLKNASSTELIDALKGILQHDFYEDPKAYLHRKNGIAQRNSFIEKMKLTKREVDIVRLVALGRDPEQIANELFLSLHTVRTHKKNIMKKLGLVSTAELMRFAFENKLTE